VEAADLFSLLTRAGLDPTPLEIAEAVWLAQLAAPPAHAGQTEDGPPSGTGAGPAGPLSFADVDQATSVAGDYSGPSLPLYLAGPPGVPGATNWPSQVGRTIRVPAVTAVPTGQALLRSMRPLRRRVPEPRHRVLDEEATADTAAQAGVVTPIMRDAAERGLSLTFVVDTGPAMAVWRRLEAELLGIFHRLGAFRDIQRWYLRAVDGVIGVSRAPSNDRRGIDQAASLGPRSPDQGGGRLQLRSPAELADPAGRRVILLLTDAASHAWYSGAVTQVLRQWAAAGPLAIVQPLPQRLWARTALAPVQGRISSTAAAIPNTRLTFRPYQDATDVLLTGAGTDDSAVPGDAASPEEPARSEELEREPARKQVPVPVLGLGPEWLAPWASFIANPGGAALDCAATFAHHPQLKRIPPTLEGADPRELVRRFAEQASPDARQLAVYLSALPISLPVMRQVQALLLPGTGPSHLAEVLLSGLLYTTDSARSPDAPEEWRYEFVKGVRDLLLAGLGRSKARRVMYVVSDAMNNRFGLSDAEFTAALAAPALADNAPLSTSVDPFAEIARHVLERVTGRFTSDNEPRAQPLAETGDPRERASLLIRRYQRTGEVTDLDEAIGLLRNLTQGDPAQEAAELAVALRLRFTAIGRQADLDDATETLQTAIAAVPPGIARVPLLAELGNTLGVRYALTGNLTDLDDAISAARGAIEDAESADQPDLTAAEFSRYAGALGGLLLLRARVTGLAADLNEAITWLREADRGQLPDAVERARTSTDLAAALRLRAAATGPGEQAADDLGAAITAMREALELTPGESTKRSARLNELAAALADRATVTGQPAQQTADLHAAADAYRQAADHQAAAAADRAEGLAGLGAVLRELARRGEPDALPEAVRSLRAAVSQTSEDDPARSRRLALLAGALLQRFDMQPTRAELTEAVHLFGLAAAAAPALSAEQARYLTDLARTYQRRHEMAHMPQDLVLAADALRQAAAIEERNFSLES
jgi:hypothetical protein